MRFGERPVLPTLPFLELLFLFLQSLNPGELVGANLIRSTDDTGCCSSEPLE